MAQILIAILGITLVVLIHEIGHYAMARAVGVRVTCVSIGFGPALFKFRPKGSPTTFQICVLPFLAYVRMAGGDPTVAPDPKDKGLFDNKSVYARALTVLGGPLANYLAAALLIFIVGLVGLREEVAGSPLVVATVETGSPAEQAGLLAGDVILSVDGVPTSDVEALAAAQAARGSRPLEYITRRSDTIVPLTITPREVDGRVTIGIKPRVTTHVRRLSVSDAAGLAVKLPYEVTVQNLEAFGDLIRRRTTEGLTGPVGMVKHVAGAASDGAYTFVATLVMISIALGYFNLLPLPFLDGGRLIFLIFEMLTRRRPNRITEAWVHAVGVLVLLGVTVLVTIRDVAG